MYLSNINRQLVFYLTIINHTGPHQARTGPEMTGYFVSTTN